MTDSSIPNSLTGVMTHLEMIDLFLRGGGVMVLLLCALIFLTKGPRDRRSAVIALLCLSLSSYLVVSSPSVAVDSQFLETVLVSIAGLVPVLVYWFAIAIFQDDAAAYPWQVALSAVAIAAAWAAQWQVALGAVRGASVLILFCHMLVVVISGQDGDLIVARRRFRRWFLVCMLGMGLVVTGLEITHLDQAMPEWLFLLQACAILGLAGAFLAWSANISSDIWETKQVVPNGGKASNPVQSALIARIHDAMSDGLWRTEGLTISKMASHLGTQEHRLRSAINEGIGHRNFASFVNSFRIREAQSMLASPTDGDRTVLSIAYDVGFSSLGPFNRAFRARTGMTPTEYRRKHINTDVTDQ